MVGRGGGGVNRICDVSGADVALLDAYQDPALEVDLSLSEATIIKQEVERLASAVATLAVTAAMPRRLSDATGAELALDKRRARRALHVQRQSLGAWGGKEREASLEERSTGAQLNWQAWAEHHLVTVQGRLRYIATWGKKTDNLRFAKSAVVRLTQELEWMEYALRD